MHSVEKTYNLLDSFILNYQITGTHLLENCACTEEANPSDAELRC